MLCKLSQQKMVKIKIKTMQYFSLTLFGCSLTFTWKDELDKEDFLKCIHVFIIGHSQKFMEPDGKDVNLQLHNKV